MKRQVLFEILATEQLYFWSLNDLKKLKKILQLIEDIKKTPFAGIGKPEALKYMDGYWSQDRRRTQIGV